MRQRVMLAMGFSNEPSLLIADEPTTALDVTIQAQILDLLRELNADLGTAVILISHDLGVIANICSRVLVMYAGEVVEEGAPEDLLTDPRHPYTWALLHAAPRLDARRPSDRRLTTIEGQPPDPRDWPCRLPLPCPLPVRDRRLCANIPRCCRWARTEPHAAGLRRAAIAACHRTVSHAPQPDLARRPYRRAAAGSCVTWPSIFRCRRTASWNRHASCERRWRRFRRCSPAKQSDWSANPAAASRRWRGWSCACTNPPPVRSSLTARTSRIAFRPRSVRCAGACR